MPWPMEVPAGRRLISDIESNGLLPGMSRDGHPPMDRMWCATVEDLDSKEHFAWSPDNSPSQSGFHTDQYWEWLMDEAGVIIGHNFLSFDSRAIKFVYPKMDWSKKLILDTLIFCKKVWPADALIGPDMKRFRANKMPGKYLKRQSLGAWGYRLGNYKGEYDGGWDKWSPAMQEYMVQDGKVNLDLWRLIERRIGWDGCGATGTYSGAPLPSASSSASSSRTAARPETYSWPWLPFWIEHEYQKINDAQQERGVAFDKDAAVKLVQELKNQQATLASDLENIFGSWWEPLDNPEKGRKASRDRVRKMSEFPDVTEPRYGKKGQRLKEYVGPPKEHTFEGSVSCRIKWTTFNPNSRRHLADRLQRVFGWQPTQRTKTGEAQVDEGAIKSIPSGVISDTTRKSIMDYFVVTKTLGMLADGNKSWLSFCDDTNRIHGRVDPLGTVTGRGAHFDPNLGQIMSVQVDEVKNAAGKVIDKKVITGIKGGFGWEARSLFTASPETFTELTGTDMSSLEFILLGHYLHPHDGGAFTERVCDPKRDPHAEHGELANLPRRHAKTMGYLYIYGGGALKAGKAVGVEEDEIAALLLDRGLPNRLRFMRKIMGENYEEPSDLDKAAIVKGAAVKKKFEGAIIGLKDLMDDAKASAEERGYMICLDGAKLFVRKPHAALNTLLQGGGAAACKLWIILFHQKMREAGYRLMVHYNQVLWVHDEKQNEHIAGLGPTIAKLSDEAAKEAGRRLGLRGEFRTESKTGHNWAETH
jgi:DNA polymerase-1